MSRSSQGLLSRGSKFASWAPGYDASALQALLYEPVHGAVMEQLERHAPRATRMLDVGCGTGRLVQAAARRYPLVIGLDPCVEMLEVGRSRGSPAARQFVCAMAGRLPFATGTFDVVTSTMSLRHWKSPAGGMSELARVLSRAGTLVIADAQLESRPTPKRRVLRRRADPGPLPCLAMGSGLAVIDERVAPSPFTVQVLTVRHEASRTG